MTSPAATAANRKQHRSGGPRTAAGKARSKKNSWKHGLSSALRIEDVGSQANLLIAPLSELLSENVDRVAMAQLECMRIQQTKVDVLNRILQASLESGDDSHSQSQGARATVKALSLLASVIPYESRADSQIRTALRVAERKSKHDAHGASVGLRGDKEK